MKADEMPTDLQILLESVRGQLDRQMFEEAWRDLQLVPHNARDQWLVLVYSFWAANWLDYTEPAKELALKDNPFSNSAQDVFSLSKDALLKLYDEKPTKKQMDEKEQQLGSPITAITSLIGEDLVLGIFVLFLRDSGDGVASLDYSCKSEGPRGPNLDAWMLTHNHACYQIEVKNWCASAKGGKQIKSGTSQLRPLPDTRRKPEESVEGGRQYAVMGTSVARSSSTSTRFLVAGHASLNGLK